MPRDGSFALALLGRRSTVHEPILNSLASKRIVDIFPCSLIVLIIVILPNLRLLVVCNLKCRLLQSLQVTALKKDKEKMTIYQVKRSDIQTLIGVFKFKPIEVRELRDGKHVIFHNGVEIPITITGGFVTIHFAEKKGDLREVRVSGMVDEWELTGKGPMRDVMVMAEKDHSPLHIYADENGVSLLIEKHCSEPRSFDWARRR